MEDDELLYVCDCPEPIDYTEQLASLLEKLDALTALLSSLEQINLYLAAAAFAILGLGVVVGFFVGWGARR